MSAVMRLGGEASEFSSNEAVITKAIDMARIRLEDSKIEQEYKPDLNTSHVIRQVLS